MLCDDSAFVYSSSPISKQPFGPRAAPANRRQIHAAPLATSGLALTAPRVELFSKRAGRSHDASSPSLAAAALVLFLGVQSTAASQGETGEPA